MPHGFEALVGSIASGVRVLIHALSDRLELCALYRSESFVLDGCSTDGLEPFRDGIDFFPGNNIEDSEVNLVVPSAISGL